MKNEQQNMILVNGAILSIVNEFTQKQAVSKRGLKEQDLINNPLNTEKQILLINKIINNVYNIEINGKKEFLLNIDNDRVLYIERNYKNFKSIISIYFKDVLTQGNYETINLPLLFEHLKSRTSYTYNEYSSCFFTCTRFRIDEKQKTLIFEKKIIYNHDLENITDTIYNEIVLGIGEHWQDKIKDILDFICAGVYATDKKNLWLLIMADSNFGKSKLFDWMNDWGGSSFIDSDDLIAKGISDKKPEDYYNKLCLVIDEALKFVRKLYEIEDTLPVRPMRNHTVYVPINSRILLSADGGTFNDEFMEMQTVNRVSCIDLRGKSNQDLGNLNISKQYGKNNIKRVMSHYLYTEIVERLEHYNNLGKNESADYAENIINRISTIYRIKKPNVYEKVNQNMNEILLAGIEKAIGTLEYSKIEDAIIYNYFYNDVRGILISRPATIIKKILLAYDETLEYELGIKRLTQFVSNIEGWIQQSFRYGDTIGKYLFIPTPIEEQIQKETEPIDNTLF